MSKATEFKEMVKQYWESEEVKEKVQTCVDAILKECEKQAKLGKTTYVVTSYYSNVDYFDKVVEILLKEELQVISLEHVSFGEWLISW